MKFYQQNFCLYCDDLIQPSLGWQELLFGPKEVLLCQKCEGKLEKIQERACNLCGRSSKGQDSQYFKDNLCYDCIRWESSKKWKGVLVKNISLYEYNGFLAELIAQFKYRGDYVLAKIFAADIKNELSNLEYDVLVPIPLSEERQYERGFNQIEALVKEARIEVQHVLSRKHTEKQSKKSREERIHLPQVFEVLPGKNEIIKGKRILLIDDIYTTGSTLRHAALTLLQEGARMVQSLALARG